MGLESANYVLYSTDLGTSKLMKIIQSLGGAESSKNSKFSIHGERYWIDLHSLEQSQTGRPATYIRVALCNPLDVSVPLRRLLDELFKSGDVVMTDTRSKLQWIAWNEQGWEELWASFLNQRSEFRRAFGNYEAAISADKVFENLHQVQSQICLL
jgi:hypothetical protein